MATISRARTRFRLMSRPDRCWFRTHLAGRAAIRFDGNSDYLLTTPLATTDDQTVAFVCQFSRSAMINIAVGGGQILNYDGPPSRYLERYARARRLADRRAAT